PIPWRKFPHHNDCSSVVLTVWRVDLASQIRWIGTRRESAWGIVTGFGRSGRFGFLRRSFDAQRNHLLPAARTLLIRDGDLLAGDQFLEGDQFCSFGNLH